MMQYGAVIFDNDGVCVDSEGLSGESDAQVLRELGVSINAREATLLSLGLTHEQSVRRIEETFGVTLPPDYLPRTEEALKIAYKTRLTAMSGVADLMQRLRVPYCVASNSPPSKLGLGLACTGLFELLYPHIYCAKLVQRGKPAPDLFLYAAERLSISPSRCVVIEDSLAGVTAGKAAGMQVIGFVGGSHHDDKNGATLLSAGADAIAASMTEIAEMLGV